MPAILSNDATSVFYKTHAIPLLTVKIIIQTTFIDIMHAIMTNLCRKC